MPKQRELRDGNGRLVEPGALLAYLSDIETIYDLVISVSQSKNANYFTLHLLGKEFTEDLNGFKEDAKMLEYYLTEEQFQDSWEVVPTG